MPSLVAGMRPRRIRPARTVVLGFASAVVIGTLMLLLPAATTTGRSAGLLQAAFTATSAVCVTGLTVVVTPEFWSPIGEVIILLLVQVGGLGIMVFASLIGVVLARRISIRGRVNAASEARSIGIGDVRNLVTSILVISLLIEAFTATFLFLRFWLGYKFEVAHALWLAVFQSVSAFNNAGFSLFSTNTIAFATDPFIALPIALAVILGGLGFPVIMQLRKEIRRPLHWSMNTNIVLWATAVLLILGTVYICAIEWSNPATLGPMHPAEKVLVGFYESVQTRTAGFDGLDASQLHRATWLGMDILMFIGAGPAGTAGGIKVTTFAVLFFIIYTELRGETAVNIFGKRLSRAVHRQAITTALLAMAVVIAGMVSIMLMTDLPLDRIMFEAISAFGTVGLTTGITSTLPAGAQVVLMLLMFIGRLGPLTLGTALVLKERKLLYEFPKERPVIG